MTSMNTVILATHNRGKIRELAGPLAALGVRVLGLGDVPEIDGDIVEDGLTFADNAFIKATTVAALTGCVCVADDSGLEVDALDGGPGVYSARYADDVPLLPGEGKDARNIRKLLAAMAGLPQEQRHCRFVSVMCAVNPDRPDRANALFARGEWDGLVLETCRGSNGFGYDPVFLDAELKITAAEMSLEEKMKRSHRARAVDKLVQAWRSWAER